MYPSVNQYLTSGTEIDIPGVTVIWYHTDITTLSLSSLGSRPSREYLHYALIVRGSKTLKSRGRPGRKRHVR